MSRTFTRSDITDLARRAGDTLDDDDREYVAFHAERLACTLNHVARAIERARASKPAGEKVRVLDVGPHFLTRCLGHWFGDEVALDALGYPSHLVPDGVVDEWLEFDLNDSQDRSRWARFRAKHDVVVMAEVIEHLYTAPNLVLACVRSLLVDGGTLILQTPNAAALRKRLILLRGFNPFERIRESRFNPGHFREYTGDELREYCLQSGFAEPEVHLTDYWSFSRWCELLGRWNPSFREGLLVVARRVPDAELDSELDSRTADGLRGSVDVDLTHRIPLGESVRARAVLRNTGTCTWLPRGHGDGDGKGTVCLGGRLVGSKADGEGVFLEQPLTCDRPVPPGEEVEVEFVIPTTQRGRFHVEFDLGSAGVAWFGEPSRHTFEVV